jgi:diguanylate cyclase (GGDEF)-like protein
MRNRAALVALAVFVIVGLMGGAFVRLVDNRRVDARRRAAAEIATTRAFSLSRHIERVMAIAERTAALVKLSGPPEFRQSALSLPQGTPLAGLSRAEGGKVVEAYPAGLAEEVGTDLRADTVRGADAAAALETGRPTAGSPIPNILAGTAMHIYAPCSPECLVIAHVRVDDLLAVSDVAALARAGYEYRLSYKDRSTQRVIPFRRSTELEMVDPIAVPVEIADVTWSLDIAPQTGWLSRRDFSRAAGIAVIVALLAALFVYDLLRRPEVLEREVEARTKKLMEATRRITTEVEQREKAEELAKHEATHDRLTGLPNRIYLVDRLARALERAHRVPEYRFGLLFMDLDRFKALNDSLGHAAGDQLLLGVAQRMEGCLRLGDILARVGGDEFAMVIFDVAEITDMLRVANRCHEALEVPFTIAGDEVFTSASIGVAVSATGYERAEDVVRDANLAMDRARRDGGARHVVFDPVMHQRALSMLQIENDLRRGIDRGELRAFFQPVVSLEHGNITGFEALIRWQHPEKGFVSPAAFLPVAESTGLIVAVDRWIMHEAARKLGEWKDRFPSDPPVSVSVNVSGKRLNDPTLVDELAAAIGQYGLDPRALRIEITEGEMMQNPEEAIAILKYLKQMKLTLLVDDFGTGYSSLSYLQRLPVDIVKIDQSFIRGMTTNPRDEEIVRAIINLAGILGLRVVAEGVETADHLAHLRELGCAYGQGYFFSKPVDAGSAEALLEANKRW